MMVSIFISDVMLISDFCWLEKLTVKLILDSCK